MDAAMHESTINRLHKVIMSQYAIECVYIIVAETKNIEL